MSAIFSSRTLYKIGIGLLEQIHIHSSTVYTCKTVFRVAGLLETTGEELG